jgi:hypothetical protein
MEKYLNTDDYLIISVGPGNMVVSACIKNDTELKEYWLASNLLEMPLHQLIDLLASCQLKRMCSLTPNKAPISDILKQILKDLGWDMVELNLAFISTTIDEDSTDKKMGIIIKRIVPLKKTL